MLKLMGFMLKFVYNGAKGVRDMTKDMKVLNKVYDFTGKLLDKWTKNLGRYKNSIAAIMLSYKKDLTDMLEGNVDVIGKVERIFGERVSSIVQTLMTPEAAMGSLIAGVVNVGAAFDKTMTKVRGELGAATYATSDLASAAYELSVALSAPFEQVAGAMQEFAKHAITDRKEIKRLVETSIEYAHAFNVEASDAASFITTLKSQFKMTNAEIRNFGSAVIEIANATATSKEAIYQSTKSLFSTIKTLKDSAQKDAIDSVAVIAGTLGETFEDASGVINNVMRAVASKQNAEFIKLNALASRGGHDVAVAFRDAVEKQDVTAAFNAIQETVKRMSKDGSLQTQVKAIAGSFENLFGVSIDVLDSMSKVSDSMQATAKSSLKAGKSTNNLTDFYKNVMSLGEQWYRVWNQLRDILLPVGAVVIGILKWLGSALENVFWALHLLLAIPFVKEVFAWSVALATFLGSLKALVAALVLLRPIVPLIIAPFQQLWAVIRWTSFGVIELTKAVAVLAWTLITTAVKAIWAAVAATWQWVASGAALNLVLSPITLTIAAIAAAIAAVYLAFTHWDKILQAIKSTFQGIWQMIKKVGAWFASWFGGSTDHKITLEKKTSGSVLIEDGNKPKKMAEGGVVSPTKGGTTVTVAEAGESEVIAPLSSLAHMLTSFAEKSSGSHEIVQAIYDVAEMFLDKMGHSRVTPATFTAPLDRARPSFDASRK